MKIMFLGLCLSLTACATTMPGRKAEPAANNSLPVKVSALQVPEYSDEYNSVVSITFQNTSERWLHVEDVGLDFTNESQLAQNVVLGDDLKAWAESYKIRKEAQNINDDLGVAAAILGGTVIAIVGAKNGNNGAAAAGAVTAVGAAGYRDIRNFRLSKLSAESAELVPEGHIYQKFSIPPKGYARRWFLLNTPQKLIVKKFSMNVKSVELGGGEYNVPLAE